MFEMLRSRILKDSLRNAHLFLIDRRVVKGGLEAQKKSKWVTSGQGKP